MADNRYTPTVDPDDGLKYRLQDGTYITFPNVDGTANQVLKTNGIRTVSWQDDTNLPAGSNTQIQYNDAGVFGADPFLNAYPDINELSSQELYVGGNSNLGKKLLFGFVTNTISGVPAFETANNIEFDIQQTYAGSGGVTGFDQSEFNLRIKPVLDTGKISSAGIFALMGTPGTGNHADIIAGTYDTEFNNFFDVLLANQKHEKINLAIFGESNVNNSYSYQWRTAPNTEATYIDAFRHVVDLAKAKGVKSKFVHWISANGYETDDFASYYPGDEYVDIIGFSAYNITPGYWRSISSIIERPYREFLKISNRPIYILESGCKPDELGQSKEKWLDDTISTIALHYPRIEAYTYFNLDTGEGATGDYKLDTAKLRQEFVNSIREARGRDGSDGYNIKKDIINPNLVKEYEFPETTTGWSNTGGSVAIQADSPKELQQLGIDSCIEYTKGASAGGQEDSAYKVYISNAGILTSDTDKYTNVTLSFWAKSDVEGFLFSYGMEEQGANRYRYLDDSLTTEWKRYSISIASNVYETGGNTIRFPWFGIGNNSAAGYIRITGIKAEYSNYPTALSNNNNMGAYALPIVDGTANQVLKTNGVGTVTWQNDTNTPAGADTQIQFNDGGVFGGDASLVWNKTTDRLGISVTSPSKKIDILDNQTTGITAGIKIDNANITHDNVRAGIDFFGRVNAAGTSSQIGTIYSQTSATNSATDLTFRANQNGGKIFGITTTTGGVAQFNNFVITEGRVGIQTNTPSTELHVNGNIRQAVSTADVSNPPTDAELDSIFGTPATVGAGFTAYINDNGADTNFYQVVSTGTSWFIFTGTKAV